MNTLWHENRDQEYFIWGCGVFILVKLPQPSFQWSIASLNQLLCGHVTQGLTWLIWRAGSYTPQHSAQHVKSAITWETNDLHFNLEPANDSFLALSKLDVSVPSALTWRISLLNLWASHQRSNSMIRMSPDAWSKPKYVHTRRREIRPPKKMWVHWDLSKPLINMTHCHVKFLSRKRWWRK